MGVDIHIRLAKYNEKDNLYHELKLYTKEKNEYKPVFIYLGRNSEMFSGLTNEEYDTGYGYFPASCVNFNSLESSLREEIEKDKEYCYGFRETTLADMKNYILEYPKVLDYDAHWDDDTYDKPFEEKPLKTNPIKYLYEDIYKYINLADWMFNCENKLSDYKIIFYFDC